MGCGLLKTLRTLKKHSAESVDFADEISDQSKYLHVHRSIEDDLIALLRSAKQSSNKSLVLLCGSAGDGKSHMLSYLKNSEHADLLEGFNIRNDATESDAPHRTAPETLSKALQAYDDNHIGDGGLEKTVVAINLGLLARFLESPSGENFKELRQYVDEVGLLKTGLSNASEIENLYFYAVDFSDYQIFLIRDGEIEADFTSTLLERVFSPTEDNPFYAARCKACGACGIDTTLYPVKQNYDFLQNKYVRDNIAEMLVEIALREKCVITARAVLDFIYEALVSPDFDIEKLVNKNAASPREFAPAYLAMTTPQLLFSSKDSNGLISKFTQLDPMNDSSGWTDEVATAFRTSEENIKSVLKGVKGTPYEETFSSCPGFSPKNISQSESARTDIKEAVLSFVIRCAYLINSCDEIRLGFERKNYIPEFVQLLYYYNIGEEKELRYLKKPLLSKAIEDWNGDYPNKYSLVKTYDDIQLLQKLSLSFGESSIQSNATSVLTRFRPEARIKITNKDKTYQEYVDFQIDYNIYELLKKMEGGYQPTLMDKTLFSGFENSYRQLLSQGTKDTDIYVVRRSEGKQPFLEFQLDDDGEFTSERLD